MINIFLYINSGLSVSKFDFSGTRSFIVNPTCIVHNMFPCKFFL